MRVGGARGGAHPCDRTTRWMRCAIVPRGGDGGGRREAEGVAGRGGLLETENTIEAQAREAVEAAMRAVEAAACVRSGYEDLPLTLGAWGCDEVLWRQTKNKKGLLDLLRSGDEERGRTRIRRLREVIRQEQEECGEA